MMVWYTCRGTHAVSMWATCNKKNVFIVFGNSQQHTLAAAAKGQYRCIESHNSQWKVANEGEDRLKVMRRTIVFSLCCLPPRPPN